MYWVFGRPVSPTARSLSQNSFLSGQLSHQVFFFFFVLFKSYRALVLQILW
ncbi:unnamed protein product [Periconia digitata]|uniref:Uncharacterized protein n=1 Tax=Periconia digitata TaxID=1303443 RepID=A0A9W4XTG0_9PLEO|nr:unnamed protein product [Periconia digitata]